MNTHKGLIVYIYKNTAFAECSNNGVSGSHDKAILIGDDIPEIFEAKEGDLVLKLVKGNLEGTAKIVPLDQPKGISGPMSGGSFIYTSDSRFSEAVRKICGHEMYGAISLHDRFEQ